MKSVTRYIGSVAALLACGALHAQNLNPQVQVTNDYEARVEETAKKGVALEIPDSLSEFRTTVNYRVFPTEYTGAYEFSPYLIAVAPEAKESGASRAFLRAGAGWSFHPVLQGVYAVKKNGLMRASLFQDLHGYAGRYRSAVDSRSFSGSDISETAGAEIRMNGVKRDFSGKLTYRGLFNGDSDNRSRCNGVSLDGHLASCSDAALSYDVKAGASWMEDRIYGPAGDRIRETAFNASGTILPPLLVPVDVRVDFRVNAALYADRAYKPLMCFNIVPKAVYESDYLRLHGGIVLHAALDGLGIAPDLRAAVRLLRGDLEAAAYVTGGRNAAAYSDFKESNHWFNPRYLRSFSTSVVRYDAGLSLRGNAFRHLQYSLKGGVASLANAPADVLSPNAADPALLDCSIKYVDFNYRYVDALLAWKSEKLDADFHLAWRRTDAGAGAEWLDLPAIRFGGKALYNWNGRVSAGLRCEVSGKRESAQYPLDGWVDLGLYGEYSMVGALSFWAQVGNLLDQDIAIAPTHVAGGLFFNAGICLKLR